MAIPLREQRVRGVPAPRQPSVAVEWGLAYEALVGLALFIGGEPESTYEVGPAWFKSVRRKASSELRATAAADLVERWDREVFSEIGPPLEGELKASAQSVSRLSHQLPAERLIVKVTRGV